MSASCSTKDRILAVLMRSKENYISGEDISKSMGISRNAVNKAVNHLRKEGFEIESTTNRGYRLAKMPDMLTTGTLLAGLTPTRMERVICLPTTASTNSHLMELSQKDAPDTQVVIAEMQTHGRGLTGTHFVSPEGAGIYLSYLIRPDVSGGESPYVKDWRLITKSIGHTVCHVLKELCGISSKLSVNELLVNDRKLGGILTQTDMELESGMIRAIVVGIGIHVHQNTSGLSENLTSVDMETGRLNNRPTLAAALILALDDRRLSLLQ